MLRWLYIQFICLHPAPFRRRFGDDMLDDFDRAPNRAKLRYLADAAASLARQWLLRPEFRRPEAFAATPEPLLETVGIPLFQTIETYKPRATALLHGGILAILSILTAVVLIAKCGGVARPFLNGVHSSRSDLMPIDRRLMAAGDRKSTVKTEPDTSDAWLKLARSYFFSMPVLRALDADRDLTLSPREIGNAATSLRELDADRNGKVTAEECGLYVNANLALLPMQAQLRRQFIGYHPVLAALDANHDGEISASEIDRAAAALSRLDRNHDGYLTPDELVPLEMAKRAGLR